MLTILFEALRETIYIVVISGILCCALGIPLGLFLFATKDKKFIQSGTLSFLLQITTNIWLAIPHIAFFLISLLAIKHVPLLADNTLIAAIIAIAAITIPMLAQKTLNLLTGLPTYLCDTAKNIGATPMQALTKMYIPEILPELLRDITKTLISITQFSAIAGIFGAGGLGYLLTQKCYQEFSFNYLLICSAAFIIITYVIHFCGNKLANFFTIK